jgi:peptide subunit release factor 1 (eRF1)
MFYFHLGQLMEQEGTMGEEVRHSKHGSGASTAHGRRGGASGIQPNPEEIVDRNLREAASFATSFFAEKNVRRVLIGGTDDNVSQLRSQLPKSWQSLIVGTFPMSMTASKDEVMERAMQIGRQAELKREQMLVKSIKTSAAKGKGGVIKLEDTLGAVHEGRVQMLLIRDGFRAPGYQCTGCGYVTSQPISACPFCGKSFSEIPDAVEMAVHQVMKLGGEVEVVHDDVMTEEIGNIGALLRY